MIDIEELEEALLEIIPGCSLGTDKKGQIIVYTGLAENQDGDLIDFELLDDSEDDEEDEEDLDSINDDPDFEPLEDEDDDE